jgi:hypothetical protein
VASLIGSNHKVDLTKPEKVIIVEIYQVNILIRDNISLSVSPVAWPFHGSSLKLHSYFYPLWRHIRLLTHFGVRQTICGMSVVEADWENLKRYNLAEIYQQGSKLLTGLSAKTEAQATPGRVSKDEAQRVAGRGTTKPE